jgi:hypothetical protein
MLAERSGCQKKRYHPILSALADRASTVFQVCGLILRWRNAGLFGNQRRVPFEP